MKSLCSVLQRIQQPCVNRLAFLARLAPCLIGIEACATAHHWARELVALGHQVGLVSPSYVKAYLKRVKNDAADAEAICEATEHALRAGEERRAAPIPFAVAFHHLRLAGFPAHQL